MLYYSPTLTAFGLSLALLPVLATIFAGNKAAKAEENVAEKNHTFLAMLKDSLEGFSVIKSFQAEKAICGQFEHSAGQVAMAKCKRRQVGILIEMLCVVA